MNFGLEGKVALVQGAGGGLGSAIALALAREGAHVAACDIDEAALAATGEKLEAVGGRYTTLPWDLKDSASFAAKHAALVAALGEVDILVNNSGGPPPSPAGGVDPAVWRAQFDAMVLSLIALTDLVLPPMKARRWGRIITSTSSGVIAPIANLGVSNTLRLALVGWSKTLASEVGPLGITSNIILPGRIATQRIRQLDEARSRRENRPVDEVIGESMRSIPLKRYGKPEEYGAVVAFLASEQASYITGSVVRVDGGLIPSI